MLKQQVAAWFRRASVRSRKSNRRPRRVLHAEQLEPRTLLSAVLLQSSFDDLAAIAQPSAGLGGTATVAAADFVPGHTGNGVQFAGANKLVRFPVASGSQQNVELDRGEVEFWYRPNYAPERDDVTHALVTIGDVYGAPRISVTEGDSLALTVVAPDWTIRSARGAWHAPLWQPGQWVHIRAAWDSRHTSDALQLFVDGVRINSNSVAGTWNMGPETAIGSVFVGAANNGGEFVADGIIDELVIRDAPSAQLPPTPVPPPSPTPTPPPTPTPTPTPAPGSNGISDPTLVVQPAPLPLPAVGVPFVDPVFGTTLVRVSDSSARGGFETHVYSQLQPFSSDNAYLLLTGSNGYVVRRMSDFSLVTGLDTSSWNAPRWHPARPHVIVHFDSNSDTDVTLQMTDVDSRSTTDVFTLPPEYQYIRVNQSFDELSDDGRWLAGMVTRNDGVSVLVTLDIENRRLGAVLPIPALYADPSTIDPVWGMVEPDWVAVSPLGKYLVVQWQRDGTTPRSGLETFDIRNGAFMGRVYDGHQHGDLGLLPDGVTEYFMTFELSGPPPNGGRPAIAIRRLPGNATASSPEFLQVLDWGNGDHISGRGPNGVSVVTAGGLASNGWNPFEEEIFIQRTDGTVQRLAHHRSTSCGYWVQPRASMSRDGRYVVFASDWGQATGGNSCAGGNDLGRGDPYIIDLGASRPPDPPPVDVQAPRVVDVRQVMQNGQLTGFVITFDEALQRKTAQKLANYRFVGLGNDGLVATRDDLLIDIASALYDASSLSVTLTLRKPFVVNQLVRLSVRGTVTDLAGNRLDGNGDGRPGDEFVWLFGRRRTVRYVY